METFDLSRLTRRKPNMDISTVPVKTYRQKACDLAFKWLNEIGLNAICVDAIHNVEVTKDNWVDMARSMYADTYFYDGWKIRN